MVSGGMSCVKYLLFAFNLVFVIFGILLLYGGFSTLTKFGSHHFEVIIDAPNNVAIALIIVGFAIFVLAFLGCCGAIKENSCMLTTFSAIILVILLIELIGAGLIFAFRNKIDDLAKTGINEAIKKYNQTIDEPITAALDDIQHSFKCCGANNASDWTENPRYSSGVNVPDSCCSHDKLVGDDCPVKNAYERGCIEALKDDIHGSVGYLGGIAIAVAIIQLIGILFACSLSRSIRKEYEVV
ncbi:leukocyte surface antigen CD53-like [Oppia nitens]|uniref:leukocyte surface antigen CD53-like n=1 Tax=Oppia nitens TaxID=1686743 RepID=UPI0023DC2E8D|nr:leukocyte surface antigen CD53-like [Oppia nitens]